MFPGLCPDPVLNRHGGTSHARSAMGEGLKQSPSGD